MSTSVPNRWLLAAAAVAMQMCLGIFYAWAVFRGPLEQAYGWSKTMSIAPYRWSILFFTLAMIVAGFWQDRKGPRLVASVGGLLLGGGCLLASFIGIGSQWADLQLRRGGGARRGLRLRDADRHLREVVPGQARHGGGAGGDGVWLGLVDLSRRCWNRCWARTRRSSPPRCPRTFMILSAIFFRRW